MSRDNNDEFIEVRHKKGKKRSTCTARIKTNCNYKPDDNEPITESELLTRVESLTKKLTKSREVFEVTDFYKEFVDILKDNISNILKTDNVIMEEVVVYGIGKFASSLIARQQLDLVNALRADLKILDKNSVCYDPVLNTVEISVLQRLGWTVPDINEEGKRSSSNKCLYYLPHCGKSLYNNLLWSNWSSHLANIIIIGNSFTSIVERTPKRVLEQCGNYILKIQPYVKEIPLPTTYCDKDVFNDTSIHIFPVSASLSQNFWSNAIQPVYSPEDSDFITASS